MMVLLILAVAVVPVIIGRAALQLCLARGKKIYIWESYIAGTFFVLLLGEIVHVGTVFLHWSFERFSMIYGIVLAATFGVAVLITGISVWKEKQARHIKISPPYKDGIFGIFVLLVLLQCLFHIIAHVPDAGFDVTLETVTTMLETNTVYQINPMTGYVYEVGIPTRLKILALPSVYAALSAWFQTEPQVVVYNLVPVFFLLLSYMTMCGWAQYLYPEKVKKQEMFMLACGVVLQFGNYATMTLSYGLFHMGYRGEVFCAGVLYPYLLLMCLQKRKLSVLLCFITEIGLVWTWYGLGGGLLICLITGITLFFMKVIEGRREAT